MRNSIILAGAAALAFTAPALAQPGGGKGGGGSKGGGAAKVERGGGGDGQKAQRGGGSQRVERQQVRGGDRQQARGNERREVRVERRAERPQKADRAPAREQRVKDVRSEQARDRQAVVRERRNEDVRLVRDEDRSRVDVRRGLDLPANRLVARTGLIDGCPPGLAAKGNGCLPPGQAKKLVGAAVPAALATAVLPPLYRSWYPDDNDYFYREENGYVYRIDRDRNLIDGFFPLVSDYSGAYYVGAAYPQDYLGYYNVPVQYRPWYADNDDYYYRYGDGSIYQVDRDGGLINSIVSLLAGDLALGQPLPTGYDVYNVPYGYRDRYMDSADAWYRYNDGYIYRVDPTTRLVQAIVETLV